MAFTGIFFQVYLVFGKKKKKKKKKNSKGYHSPLKLACEQALLGLLGIWPERPGRAYAQARPSQLTLTVSLKPFGLGLCVKEQNNGRSNQKIFIHHSRFGF